jgi:uncharacterized protein (TIGR02466 family)
MKTHSLFPTLVYQDALLPKPQEAKLLKQSLLHEITICQEEDKLGQLWSKRNYRHGYTSYGSRDRLFDNSPTFAELGKKIDQHLKKYLKSLCYEANLNSLVLNTMWVNVMPKGAYHTMHIHPQSVISGTYYVEIPLHASAIKFQDPRAGLLMNSPKINKSAPSEMQRFYQVEPRAGDVVLFESWLSHEVPENKSSKPRVSVSFNYDWISG